MASGIVISMTGLVTCRGTDRVTPAAGLAEAMIAILALTNLQFLPGLIRTYS